MNLSSRCLIVKFRAAVEEDGWTGLMNTGGRELAGLALIMPEP